MKGLYVLDHCLIGIYWKMFVWFCKGNCRIPPAPPPPPVTEGAAKCTPLLLLLPLPLLVLPGKDITIIGILLLLVSSLLPATNCEASSEKASPGPPSSSPKFPFAKQIFQSENIPGKREARNTKDTARGQFLGSSKKGGGDAERSRKRRQKEEAFRTPRPDVTPLFAPVFWLQKIMHPHLGYRNARTSSSATTTSSSCLI